MSEYTWLIYFNKKCRKDALDSQTLGETNRSTSRDIGRQIDRWKSKRGQTDRHKKTDRERQIEGQTDRGKGEKGQTADAWEIQIEGHTDRGERQKETDGQTQKINRGKKIEEQAGAKTGQTDRGKSEKGQKADTREIQIEVHTDRGTGWD